MNFQGLSGKAVLMMTSNCKGENVNQATHPSSESLSDKWKEGC